MAIYSIEALTNLHVGDMGTSCSIPGWYDRTSLE